MNTDNIIVDNDVSVFTYDDDSIKLNHEKSNINRKENEIEKKDKEESESENKSNNNIKENENEKKDENENKPSNNIKKNENEKKDEDKKKDENENKNKNKNKINNNIKENENKNKSSNNNIKEKENEKKDEDENIKDNENEKKDEKENENEKNENINNNIKENEDENEKEKKTEKKNKNEKKDENNNDNIKENEKENENENEKNCIIKKMITSFKILWEHFEKERFNYGFFLPDTLIFQKNKKPIWYFNSKRSIKKKRENCILKKSSRNFSFINIKKSFSVNTINKNKEIVAIKIINDKTDKNKIIISNLNSRDFLESLEKYTLNIFENNNKQVIIQKYRTDICILKVIWISSGNYFIIEELWNKDFSPTPSSSAAFSLNQNNEDQNKFVDMNLKRKIKYICLRIQNRIKFISFGNLVLKKMSFLCKISNKTGKIIFMFFIELKIIKSTNLNEKIILKNNNENKKEIVHNYYYNENANINTCNYFYNQNFQFSIDLKLDHFFKYKTNLYDNNVKKCCLCKISYEIELIRHFNIKEIFLYSSGNSKEISNISKIIFSNNKYKKKNGTKFKKQFIEICVSCLKKIQNRNFNSFKSSQNPNFRNTYFSKQIYNSINCSKRRKSDISHFRKKIIKPLKMENCSCIHNTLPTSKYLRKITKHIHNNRKNVKRVNFNRLKRLSEPKKRNKIKNYVVKKRKNLNISIDTIYSTKYYLERI